jgi:hypothetical protein
MKIVYVVTGSEDGILGVYGNKKGAYNEALNYVNQDNEDRKFISYSTVCKELKDVYNYSVEICNDNIYGNASIHAILFNPKENK